MNAVSNLLSVLRRRRLRALIDAYAPPAPPAAPILPLYNEDGEMIGWRPA